MSTEEYKHFCDKCNYGTNHLCHYNKHLETSTHKTGKRGAGKQPAIHQCEHCEYTTTFKNNFKTHYLRHHSTKAERAAQFKHYCDACDHGTFSATEKATHMKSNNHKLNMGE
jgi:hypothetical protein